MTCPGGSDGSVAGNLPFRHIGTGELDPGINPAQDGLLKESNILRSTYIANSQYSEHVVFFLIANKCRSLRRNTGVSKRNGSTVRAAQRRKGVDI